MNEYNAEAKLCWVKRFHGPAWAACAGPSCKRGTLLCPLLSSHSSSLLAAPDRRGPGGEICGGAPLSCHWAWRDYADSCWSEEARRWPAPDVNLNTSLRSLPRFWGLTRKNVRKSREIWSQICCVTVHVQTEYEDWMHWRRCKNQQERVKEAKELDNKWMTEFASCHQNSMSLSLLKLN